MIIYAFYILKQASESHKENFWDTCSISVSELVPDSGKIEYLYNLS